MTNSPSLALGRIFILSFSNAPVADRMDYQRSVINGRAFTSFEAASDAFKQHVADCVPGYQPHFCKPSLMDDRRVDLRVFNHDRSSGRKVFAGATGSIIRMTVEGVGVQA